jgi:hypothetical protein
MSIGQREIVKLSGAGPAAARPSSRPRYQLGTTSPRAPARTGKTVETLAFAWSRPPTRRCMATFGFRLGVLLQSGCELDLGFCSLLAFWFLLDYGRWRQSGSELCCSPDSSVNEVGRVSYVRPVVEKEAEYVLFSHWTSNTQLINMMLPVYEKKVPRK